MTDTKVQFPDVSRFSAVDETLRPQQLIEVLDVAKQLPGFPAAKAQLLDGLEPEHASSAIDVGCGYGADVIELAQRLRPGGGAVGVAALLDRVRASPGDHLLDVDQLVGEGGRRL